MGTVISLVAIGIFLGTIAWGWFDHFVIRWEMRNLRDWVTQEALFPDVVIYPDGRETRL